MGFRRVTPCITPRPFKFTRSIVILKTFALLCAAYETLRRDTRASMRSNWREGREKKKKKGRKELDSWEISMVLSRFDSIRSLDDYPFTISPIFHSSITYVSHPIDRFSFHDDTISLSFSPSSSYFWRSPEKKRSITNWKKNG